METSSKENSVIEDDDCKQLGESFSEAFISVMPRDTRVSEQDANAMVAGGFRVSDIEDTVMISGGSRILEQEGAIMASGETWVSEQDAHVVVADESSVSAQVDVAMSSGDIKFSKQEVALYSACSTGGGELLTVKGITGKDLEEGKGAAVSALEGVEFVCDTEFLAAQFHMDSPKELMIGTVSDEHCEFSARTKNREVLAVCVQNDEKQARDKHSEADAENVQVSVDGDEVDELPHDDEHGTADMQEIYLECASDANVVLLGLCEEEVEISQGRLNASTPLMHGESMMAVEEVEEYQARPLSTACVPAAVKICPHEQELSSSCPELGVGNASRPDVTSEKEGMHVQDVNSMLGLRAETDATHEGDASQTELKQDIHRSCASEECGPVVNGAEEIQLTALRSIEVGAAEQTVVAEKYVLQDKKGDSDSPEIVHTENKSSNAVVEMSKCVRVLADNVQENIPVGVSKNISMKTEEPTSQSLVQKEEITVKQHVIEDDYVISCMSIDESPLNKQVKKHSDDPMLMGRNIMNEFDAIVSEAVQWDGDEFSEEAASVPAQGKTFSRQHQEDHYPNELVDTCPPQGGAAEQSEKQEIFLQETAHLDAPTVLGTVVPWVPDCLHLPDNNILEQHTSKNISSDGEKIHNEENGGELFFSEPEEENSAKKLQKAHKEGRAFSIGDLVWAKVRSHPWWPAQIFDPADASTSAKKVERSGRVLVAFFGDCTFAWLQQSQMIAFRPNFKEKVKQTTMKSFCKAVAEALEEFCRRSELGLNCPHFKGSLHSTSMFPDANAGIQKGVRVKSHKDILTSVETFKPDKTLEFVKGVACSPFGSWSSTLEASELRGHAYGLRTCMVASGSSNADDLLRNMGVERAVSAHEFKLKRIFSPLETDDDDAAAEEGIEAKKVNMGEKESTSEGESLSPTPTRLKTPFSKESDHTEAVWSDVDSEQVVQGAIDLTKGKRACHFNEVKGTKKVKHDRLLCPEASSDAGMGEEMEGEKSADDGSETLFALAGYHSKVLKRSGLREDGKSGFIKKKVHGQSMGEAQDANSISDMERAVKVSSEDGAPVAKSHHKRTSDSDLAAFTKSESKAKDALNFTPLDSDEKSSDADVEVLKSKKSLNAKKSPAPLLDLKKVQLRTVEAKKKFNSLDLELRDGLIKASKVAKPKEEVVVKREMQSSAIDTPKKEDVKKLNKAVKLGDSIRKVAGDLAGTPSFTKCVDESSAKSMRPGPKKETKGLDSESPGSPKYRKAVFKESPEEWSHLSLVQLHQDLELLARDPLNNAGMSKPSGRVTEALLKFRTKVFKKSSGYGMDAALLPGEQAGKAVKHSKKGDQVVDAKAVAVKSPPRWHSVPHRNQRPGVQELALAARKRKSEIVQEVVAKAPKKILTSGPPGYVSTKEVISTEKPVEPRCFEKNIIQYARRPVLPAFNVRSSAQRYDEKLSSQLPLGLFMRFPTDFALPSESQIKATFVPFGPLQNSGTRVYKDSASAQVVFKHGRDAEFALKHARKNPMFGQAAVTYRLRYFSHSLKADSKKDALCLGKVNSSARVDGRVLLSSKQRTEGCTAMANASSQNRTEHGGTGTSETMQILSNDATNSWSEPTGDIQDKMMTLLRQVSVIVGTAPVPSDAT